MPLQDAPQRVKFKAASQWVASVILCVLVANGCAYEGNLQNITANTEKMAINIEALAETLVKPELQPARREAIQAVQPGEGSFPWSEVFGGIISALLLAITGVQFKKFGTLKSLSKKGDKE